MITGTHPVGAYENARNVSFGPPSKAHSQATLRRDPTTRDSLWETTDLLLFFLIGLVHYTTVAAICQ